ncbi:MAG: hypothetical protein ACRERC_07150 [Candidatus Binatia bacterium]
MSLKRALSRGAVLAGAWWLVQIPAKDVRLTEPGSNLPPITQFKKVRQFSSGGDCEAFRDVALQDSAMMGSEAMLDQSSQLRCVAEEQLAAPPTLAPTPDK